MWETQNQEQWSNKTKMAVQFYEEKRFKRKGNHYCGGYGTRTSQKVKNTKRKKKISMMFTQEGYNISNDKLYNIYDKGIPLKKHKNTQRRKISWITNSILISRKTKYKLYKKYLTKPTVINEANYKKYRNRFNKLKKAARKLYYDNKFLEYKDNLKTTRKLINDIINNKKIKSSKPDTFFCNWIYKERF